MLSMTRPRFDVENNNARRYTFGSATWSRERGVSGPKKMTVGCVILTVPRRNNVNHAVTVETLRANAEMVIDSGSAMQVLIVYQARSVKGEVTECPETFWEFQRRLSASALARSYHTLLAKSDPSTPRSNGPFATWQTPFLPPGKSGFDRSPPLISYTVMGMPSANTALYALHGADDGKTTRTPSARMMLPPIFALRQIVFLVWVGLRAC
jgi:hypothetical protein